MYKAARSGTTRSTGAKGGGGGVGASKKIKAACAVGGSVTSTPKALLNSSSPSTVSPLTAISLALAVAISMLGKAMTLVTTIEPDSKVILTFSTPTSNRSAMPWRNLTCLGRVKSSTDPAMTISTVVVGWMTAPSYRG